MCFNEDWGPNDWEGLGAFQSDGENEQLEDADGDFYKHDGNIEEDDNE